MAWTSATLKQAIQDYCETNETTFVNNLDNIILQAEDRILKTIQLPDFRKNVTGIVSANDQYLGWPGDFLAPYSLAVDNSGYEFLIFKDVNFIFYCWAYTKPKLCGRVALLLQASINNNRRNKLAWFQCRV
jgi:hypothetical protein